MEIAPLPRPRYTHTQTLTISVYQSRRTIIKLVLRLCMLFKNTFLLSVGHARICVMSNHIALFCNHVLKHVQGTLRLRAHTDIRVDRKPSMRTLCLDI